MYVEYADGAYLYVWSDKTMEWTNPEGEEFKYNPKTEKWSILNGDHFEPYKGVVEVEKFYDIEGANIRKEISEETAAAIVEELTAKA
jgi:hypothetical protein